MRRILVATDLSPSADEALRQAHDRAASTGAALAVCHVVPNLLWSYPLSPQRQARSEIDAVDVRRRAAELVVDRMRGITGRDPGHFELMLGEGSPHAAIVSKAEEWGADLVVLGSSGATGMARVLLGSIADQILRHAHCSVLLARPHARTGKLLAATDFSDPALPAVRAAVEEGRRLGARVTLLHAVDHELSAHYDASSFVGYAAPVSSPNELEDVRRATEERLKDSLRTMGIDGDTRVVMGPPVAAIVAAVEDIDAELVVVGTTGRTGLRRMLLGSVAEGVSRWAPCSVLVVRVHPR